MLKISGMALIVLCCSMMGFLKAATLSNRVIMLENVIRLYQYLHDRLKFLQPSVNSLIEQASSSQEFSNIEFLSVCNVMMNAGKSFPESWRESVYSIDTILDVKDIDIIQNISNTLGMTDIESQLAALGYDKARLGSNLEEARDYAAKHKKMYQTLGVLSGLLIAIFIA